MTLVSTAAKNFSGAGTAPVTISETDATSKGLVITTAGAGNINALEINTPDTAQAVTFTGNGSFTFQGVNGPVLDLSDNGTTTAVISATSANQASVLAQGGAAGNLTAKIDSAQGFSYIRAAVNTFQLSAALFQWHAAAIPVDGSLNASDVNLSYIDTNGQAHLAIKAKEAGGTVRTGVIPINRQTAQASPGNPAGTASTVGVMMGLAGAITPNSSGVVLIMLSGDIFNVTAIADGGKVQLRTGTGGAPGNAAALTGTTAGGLVQYIAATTAEKAPFALQAIVSGLALGTAVWIDVGLAAITGGTATIENLSLTAVEL